MGDCVKSALGGQRHLVMVAIAVIFISFRNNRTENIKAGTNVVRQTVSKWEQGLSVPDSELLISISEILETQVGVLLGETVKEPTANDIKAISEKLEVTNLQLARRSETRWKALHAAFLAIGILITAGFLVLLWLGSPYLNWNFNNPETAVLGTVFHSFEWVFVRIAPFALIGKYENRGMAVWNIS